MKKSRLTLVFDDASDAYLRLFVHALAQVPDDLRLTVSGASIRPAEALIAAYGLGHRVDEAEPRSRPGPCQSLREFREQLGGARHGDVAVRVPRESSYGRLSLADIVEALTLSDGSSRPPSPPPDLRGQRIALITNIPNHYRAPLFNALAERLAAAGATLLVLFLGHSYGRRAWVELPEMTFDHVFLTSVGVPMSRAWHPFIPRDLGKTLTGFGPTAVVCAGFSPLVAGRSARIARRLGARFGIWSGETSTGITGSNRVRMLQRGRLLKRCDAALVYGSRAEEYVTALRPDLPAIHVRNTTPVADTVPRRTRDGRPIEILSVAEARSGKRLDLVIDAAAECLDLDWHLTFVGDGPDRPALEERAAPLGDRVTFTGAVPSSRVGEYYRKADIFMFPSEIDVFGLVVVEAFGSGLATLVSPDPGVVADLCASEVNSLVVPGRSPAEWGRYLRRVIEDDALRVGLAEAARRTISNRWTIDHSVHAFTAGLRAVTGVHHEQR
ncbi:MAG: glycosyltransferase family 4 protein [Actinomycetota bacterium]